MPPTKLFVTLLVGFVYVVNSAPTENDLIITTEAYPEDLAKDMPDEVPNYDSLHLCEPVCPTSGFSICTEKKCNKAKCCFDTCKQKAVCSDRQKRESFLWKKYLLLASANDYADLDEQNFATEDYRYATTDNLLFLDDYGGVIEKRDASEEVDDDDGASISLTRTRIDESDPEDEELKYHDEAEDDLTVSREDDRLRTSLRRKHFRTESSRSGNENGSFQKFNKEFSKSSVSQTSTVEKRDIHRIHFFIIGETEDEVSSDNATSVEYTATETSLENITEATEAPQRVRRQIVVPTIANTSYTETDDDSVPEADLSETPFYDLIIEGYSHQSDKKIPSIFQNDEDDNDGSINPPAILENADPNVITYEINPSDSDVPISTLDNRSRLTRAVTFINETSEEELENEENTESPLLRHKIRQGRIIRISAYGFDFTDEEPVTETPEES